MLIKSNAPMPCRSTMERLNNLQMKWYDYVDNAPNGKVKKPKQKDKKKYDEHGVFHGDPSDKWGAR